MKKILLLCALAIAAKIWASDAPLSKSAEEQAAQGTKAEKTEENIPKNDLTERLEIANQIVRLEISPRQIEDELAKGVLQWLIEKLDGDAERKDDLNTLREAMEAVSDKVISSGKVWDEYSARYATHFTLEELKELKVLLRHPLLLKRDKLREDFFRRELQEVIFFVVGDVAAKEAEKVQALISEIFEKLPPDTTR